MGLMVGVACVLPLCTALLLVLPAMMLSGFAFAQGRPVFVYPVDGQTLDYLKTTDTNHLSP